VDKVEMMKIHLVKIIILFSIILYSCNDPIFFKVHEESPVLKPLIDGSPTNFVEYDNKLYVASGKKIFSYSNNGWSEWKALDDFVMCLAAAGSSLYALYLDNDNGKIRRYYNNGNSSENLNLSYNVQSIHASEDILFISVRDSGNSYTIYFRKEGSAGFTEIPVKKTDPKNNIIPLDSHLNGVASDGTYYYLCTYYGIFYVRIDQIDSASDLPVLGRDANFTGITELKNNYCAAISNNGDLYEIKDAGITQAASFSDDRKSTYALAPWYRYNTDTMPSLLLVGRKEYYYSTTTGYTYGYLEIALDTVTGGIQSGARFIEPGRNAPSSIDNYDRYVSSLGKKPVNHIIQTPASIDGNMTLFASTQQDGVWSYRNRGDGMLWNAEQ
jgi:hypothetical protein